MTNPTIAPTIAVIGAGRIGRQLAQKIAETGQKVYLFNRAGSSSEQVICDEVNSVNNAIAAREGAGKIILTFDLNAIKNQQLIHFVAGAPRGKNEERSALFKKNATIADGFILTLAKNNPKALIVNAANPLDTLTRHIYETLRKHGFEQMVIGMGSSLDTKRLHQIVCESCGRLDADVREAWMLGEHGPTMTPVLSRATIDGKPLTSMFTPEKIASITERTRNRGKQIIIETEHSDVKGPALRLFEITEVVIYNKEAFIPCCLLQDNGVFMGQVGYFKGSTIKRYRIPMSVQEEQEVAKSCEHLKAEWEYLTAEPEKEKAVGKTTSRAL